MHTARVTCTSIRHGACPCVSAHVCTCITKQSTGFLYWCHLCESSSWFQVKQLKVSSQAIETLTLLAVMMIEAPLWALELLFFCIWQPVLYIMWNWPLPYQTANALQWHVIKHRIVYVKNGQIDDGYDLALAVLPIVYSVINRWALLQWLKRGRQGCQLHKY